MCLHALKLDLEVDIVEDLTAHEVGDIDLWIGQQKEYRNVPNYVSNELCQRAFPCVPVHHPPEFGSTPFLRSLYGTPTRPILSGIVV